MARGENDPAGPSSSPREPPASPEIGATPEIFSTRLATLLTMAGVAIGLGNVWRFPYMMGRYGGSAFLLVYLLFTLIFAVPALMAEWTLGRATRRGPVGAFTAAFGPAAGRLIGGLLLLTVLVADSYYLVVIAGIVYTAWFAVARGFDAAHLAGFQTGLADGRLQYVIALALLLATLAVIHRGLRRGIEAASRLCVPFFGVVVVGLVAYTLSLPGVLAQLAIFLRPDLSALRAEHLFAALGQTFFSVGLGGTFMLVYGGYLREREPIPSAAVATALGDAGAALLASLFIVPAILAFGLDMTSGPGLIFDTLPRLFGAMPAGRWVGSLFLVALTLMAFLSNVAALEVFVRGAGEIAGRGRERGAPAAAAPSGRPRGAAPSRRARNRVILLALGLETLLMLPSALDTKVIAILDLVFGSGMQVLGSALAVVALVWGLGRRTALAQIFGAAGGAAPRPGEAAPRRGADAGRPPGGRAVPPAFMAFTLWWLRWAVPLALVAILAGFVHSKIS